VDHPLALILRTGRGHSWPKQISKKLTGCCGYTPKTVTCWRSAGKIRFSLTKSYPLDCVQRLKYFQQWQVTFNGWCLNNGLQGSLHYLDDFFIVSPSQTSAEFDKQVLVSLWERLGVPMEMSKLDGPSQTIKFLGIDFSWKECLFGCIWLALTSGIAICHRGVWVGVQLCKSWRV